MLEINTRLAWRLFKSKAAIAVLMLLSLVAVTPLILVFQYIVSHGIDAMNWDFFTKLPAAVGEPGGGMAHALWGSVTVVGLASLVGVPVGILTGVFLSEYAPLPLAQATRFVVDLLTSIPSIVIGLFAYSSIVVTMGGFSAYAGAAALAMIMFPIVAKTTEEILKLVPYHLREAGLALGLARWRVTLLIVLKGSFGAVITGVMLAVARVSGETAPLLFTAFSNSFWSESLRQPIATLPVQIYNYAISPFEEWHRQAWAGAVLLVSLVFVMNVTIRLIMKRTLTR